MSGVRVTAPEAQTLKPNWKSTRAATHEGVFSSFYTCVNLECGRHPRCKEIVPIRSDCDPSGTCPSQ
jgi:hypothetical protein